MLYITVHRGTHQIGGCITQISTEHCKIIIDLGNNLPGSVVTDYTHDDVVKLTSGVDALFYTHYHGDHVGLFHYVPKQIPQYIGKGAKEIMLCKFEELGKSEETECVRRMLTYKARQRIDVAGKGEISVTPYYVSHSAFDAYMFKIECDGKVILHTGDFRKHGYLGGRLPDVLRLYVKQVDLLITEGTMLGRYAEKVLSEAEVKQNIQNCLLQHKYVFVLSSSTDMERLASFHQACIEAKRYFRVDGYQRNILEIFNKYTSSDYLKFNNYFTDYGYESANIIAEMKRRGFLMAIRTKHLQKVSRLLRIYNDEPAWLIYSMWKGYAEVGKVYANSRILAVRELFEGHIKDGTDNGVHTSGHADIDTLREVCNIVRPRMGVIPIHKDQDANFGSIGGIDGYRIFTEEVTQLENLKIVLK